jgi:hypothetical protein
MKRTTVRRIEHLEGARAKLDRTIFVITCHHERSFEAAIAEVGVEPKNSDVVVRIATYDDADRSKPARLNTAGLKDGP